MDKYIMFENKKTIWTVGKDKSKTEAISMANEKFKVKRDLLEAVELWEKDDQLYLSQIEGVREVWAVYKGGKE